MKVTASTESAASLDSFPGCDGAFPMTVVDGRSGEWEKVEKSYAPAAAFFLVLLLLLLLLL